MRLRRREGLILAGCLLSFILVGCGSPQQEPPAAKAKPIAATAAKPPAPTEAPKPYALGQTLNFNDAQVEPYLREGWSGRESWGRWTDGPVAELRLPMDKFSTDGNYALTLTCGLFQPDKQTVIASLNGIPIGKIGPSPGLKGSEVRLPFQGKLLKQDNLIRFDIQKPITPREAGMTEGDRKLGLSVINVKIDRGQ